jgi:negative regulator of flagellin synthesis FlgM
MQIYGPFRVSAAQQTSPAQRNQPQQTDPAQAKPANQADQLDLSSSVNRLDSTQVAGSGEIRVDRVAELRRQIADGSYETPEKLDAALDRMLDQLA